MKLNFEFMLAILALSTVAIAKAHGAHADDPCTNVQCPEVNCPSDSHINTTKIDYPDIDYDSLDEINFDDIIEVIDVNKKISPKFQHTINRRSYEYRPRENIKIVPEDHRKFDREFQNQLHHNGKFKRDLQSQCCSQQCICKKCDEPLKCKFGKVAIITKESSGNPGNCCPTYECSEEPICNNSGEKTKWHKDCKVCECMHGHMKCFNIEGCVEESEKAGCVSESLQKIFQSGETWKESEGCSDCACDNGEIKCEISFCKPVDCQNPIKLPGQCCKVCPIVEPSTSTTTERVEIPVDPDNLSIFFKIDMVVYYGVATLVILLSAIIIGLCYKRKKIIIGTTHNRNYSTIPISDSTVTTAPPTPTMKIK